MILVFDTETSNLPSKNLALDNPMQGRIVQLAFVMFDEQFKERASFCALIKPTEWIIQPGAQSAHGITQEQCLKYGIDIKDAIEMYHAMILKCEIFVAHNIKFDNQMISIEQDYLGNMFSHNGDSFCTMNLMTDICKLPSARGGYKWPKLQEAYNYVTGHQFIGAHDALRDCRATAEIFKWLVDRKHISLPSLVLA